MRHIGSLVVFILTTVGARHSESIPRQPLRFVTVTAGADHACALNDRGEAYCWGSNRFGQLGIGTIDTTAHSMLPRVAGDLKFTTLVAGFTHTCGIVREGAAYCWGANESGQLGDGTFTPRSTPTRVKTDLRFQMIGPGGAHTCGVSTDSIGYCWGGNWHGQIGEGSRSGDTPCCFLTPVRIRTALRFRSVVAGGIHSCGIAVDNTTYCWGSPQQGRLGSGADDAKDKTVDKTVPTAVAGGLMFATVAPRSWHTCALLPSGAANCWGGAGAHGLLGSGNALDADASSPRHVAAAADFSVIAAGHLHNCALTRDGVAYCWGANADGELGDGTTRDAAAPQRVATDRRFVSLAAGGNVFVATNRTVSTWGFTCGVTADVGAILCWGDNRHGELGSGTTERALVPIPVTNVESPSGGR